MILRIRHKLEYAYDRPVFIEPTTIRLRPHCDCTQKLIDFALRISPEPAGRSECIDMHGNVVTTVWFNDQHDHMNIEANSTVQPLLENPFDYLITDPNVFTLPMCYAESSRAALAPYLARNAPEPAIDQLAHQLAQRCGGRTIEFLSSLTEELHDRCHKIVRPDGDPLPPAETLRRGAGACRDLAVLFMDASRAMGLAARFVSGYQHHDQASAEDRDMHAWAQVYLPGAGWRGYDPSWGLATAGAHICVAAASHPADAAPTCGTFRGSPRASSLRFEVNIQAQADP